MFSSKKLLVGGVLLAILIAGCATIEQLAPPVDDSMLGAAVPRSQLEHGRRLYITTCARCHSPEPVTGYTRRQWRNILPRMAEDAALTEAQREAVEAYVMAVLSAPDQPDREILTP